MAKFEFSFFGDLSGIRCCSYLSLFVANFFAPPASLSGVFSFSVSLWPPIEFAFIAFIVGAAVCGRPAYCEWLDVA